MASFFDLPGDILSKIYGYDGTFSKVFANRDVRDEIRTCRSMIRGQSPELMKHFIQSAVIEFYNFNMQCKLVPPGFKIILYPHDYFDYEIATKFKIVRENVDPVTIVLDEYFDGFVKHQDQTLSLWNRVEPCIILKTVDLEAGLDLHLVDMSNHMKCVLDLISDFNHLWKPI